MITAETLLVVYGQTAVHGLSEATLRTLRRNWSDPHFTLCSDDDVPARLTPVVEGGASISAW